MLTVPNVKILALPTVSKFRHSMKFQKIFVNIYNIVRKNINSLQRTVQRKTIVDNWDRNADAHLKPISTLNKFYILCLAPNCQLPAAE